MDTWIKLGNYRKLRRLKVIKIHLDKITGFYDEESDSFIKKNEIHPEKLIPIIKKIYPFWKDEWEIVGIFPHLFDWTYDLFVECEDFEEVPEMSPVPALKI